MGDKFYIPHDELAERAFVGGLLADDGNSLDELPEISLELFWTPATRLAMRSLLDQRKKGAPCGLIGLTQYMNAAYSSAAEKPVDGGWPAFLTGLLGDAATRSSLAFYLGVLREALAMRRLHSLQAWLVNQIAPGANVTEIVRGVSARLANAEPQADESDHALPAVVETILGEIDDINAGHQPKVLRTPLAVWNNAFGGLPTGAYLALGGRPGAGKSSMMEQIIFELMNDEIPVLLFEKDMSLKMLVYRLACRACGVPYWKISKGYANREERDAVRGSAEYFTKTNFRLHNPHGLTADTLAAIVRREKRLHGVQAVFLDHIQLLDTGDAETVDGLTRASNKIKASAHDTDIPHTVLFQINRNAPQGIRPKPEHVKGFDQLLSDVDGMAMLWTEQDKTKLTEGQKLEVYFYAVKNRSGGETEQSVWFDGPRLTFCDAN